MGATNEFRYYLDLNRNRRHDVTGLWPVLSSDPVNRYVNTNGFLIPLPIPGNTLSNFVVGDPEWIGGLDRPDKPHGPENKYLFRYAYAAAGGPDAGREFHPQQCQARQSGEWLPPRSGGGRVGTESGGVLARPEHQSVGRVLRDQSPSGCRTFYLPSTGTAFDDAYNFWLWRRGGVAQQSVQNLFGNIGPTPSGSTMLMGIRPGALLWAASWRTCADI